MPINSTRGAASAKAFGFTASNPFYLGARGVFGGGQNPGTYSNIIDYITIASAGNAADFGDLTVARGPAAGVNSLTRGVIGNGNDGAMSDVLDFITIASTGNATDFGDAVQTSFGTGGSACNRTRGLLAGGYVAPNRGTNVIQFITIATTGNATDFGDLTIARYQVNTQIASSTRGVFAGGNT